MSKSSEKFVMGAAILAVAGIISKILGAVFRIPLDNWIGTEGMGYYQSPYPIYALLLSISYLGIPASISKLVSEKRAQGKYKEAHEIFKSAFLILGILGLIFSFCLYFFAPIIIERAKWSNEVIYSFYGLALAPFFVSIMGAFRGYFQGMQNMQPTALSQTIEAFGRVLVGLGLALYLLRYGIGQAAGGASFGATAGGALATLFLAGVYFKNRPELKREIQSEGNANKVSKLNSMLLIVLVALPISISGAINSILSMIDSFVAQARLQSALGYTKELAASAYGVLSGRATTLVNMPLTVAMAIILSIMPAVSNAIARGDKKDLHEKIDLGIRFSLFLGLPAATGLAILAGPIIKLLYPKDSVGTFTLVILSISLIFIILGQLFATILQGAGGRWLWVPIVNLGIIVFVKYIATYYFVGMETLNINGAALATVLAYLVYCILNYIFIKRQSGFRLMNLDSITKTILSTVVMAVITMGSFYILSYIPIYQKIIPPIGAVLIGVMVYFAMLVMTGAIKDEDYEIMPYGDKIKKMVRR